MSAGLPGAGELQASMLQSTYGGSGIVKFSEYYANSATAYTRDVNGTPVTGQILKISTFCGKGRMNAPGANSSYLNTNNARLSWSVPTNPYAFMRITAPSGTFNDVAYGTYQFDVTGLNASNALSYTITPYTDRSNAGTPQTLALSPLPTTVTSATYLSSNYSNVVISWSGGIYGFVRVRASNATEVVWDSGYMSSPITSVNVTNLLGYTNYGFSIWCYNALQYMNNNTFDAGVKRTRLTPTVAVANINVVNSYSNYITIQWAGGLYGSIRVTWSTSNSGFIADHPASGTPKQ